MNAKQRNEVRALTRRGVLALSGAAALWCAMALPCVAQVEPPKAQSAPSAKSTAAANENVFSTAQKPTMPLAAEKKGQREGITVHGHWIIDVKNPDGKVTKHVEFENSISPGGSFSTKGGTLVWAGGNAFLSALLAGQAVSPAGSWAILLEGPDGLADSTGGPCTTGVLPFCTVMQNSPNNPSASTACTPVLPGVSCNLGTTPLGSSPNFSGFQLSGSIAAPQSGEVSTVATTIFGACGPSSGPLANCALASTNGVSFFTSKSDFPGAPLAVAAGQTLAVTVQISFQ